MAVREVAHEENVDLILFCAHGNTGDPRRRFGELPADFLRECDQPVLIIQDLAQQRAEPRGAATDRPGH